VAKAFKIKATNINDDPINIYKKLKNYNFKEPFLINIRTNRLYWHSGAGKDSKIVFDRLGKEIEKLGNEGKKIHLQNKNLINNLWKKILETQ
jgi:hypothetical protein